MARRFNAGLAVPANKLAGYYRSSLTGPLLLRALFQRINAAKVARTKPSLPRASHHAMLALSAPCAF
jgi:hypothetical protein